MVASRPAWAAIREVVQRDETQLQLLVRLAPVNSATVAYLPGAFGVRFAGFMLACVGLLPHLLISRKARMGVMEAIARKPSIRT